eukprot:gnl/MRDRNA2_/MRDRNA2_71858_c0_seq1.p1 gnl/MRDRNA2_/MRDRNA2_71858_c0~~gnl/MRDRNA2_/MRDRNA2_71858_c0_seq1.p1  ORF type:complete len:628 (+),score=127.76 gnl/MRDRNA2_/MRDRNA2_71858_c0_seq1:84-1967(+)
MGFAHMVDAAYFIANVTNTSTRLLHVNTQEELATVREQLQSNQELRIGERSYQLLSEGPLANISDSVEQRQRALEELVVPATLTVRHANASAADDLITAVNLAKPSTGSRLQFQQRQVDAAFARFTKARDMRPAARVLHYLGGPNNDKQVRLCIVPGHSGNDFSICNTLDEALVLADRMADECCENEESSRGLAWVEEAGSEFFEGQRVRLVGLHARPELNGAAGAIVRFLPPSCDTVPCRWLVKLSANEDKAVRPENLVAVGQEFFEGQKIQVFGYPTRSVPNGTNGTIREFMPVMIFGDGGLVRYAWRWLVKLELGDSGVEKAVLPEHLVAVGQPQWRTRPRVPVHAFWGEGRWTRVQLLAELAQGFWGLCHAQCKDFRKPAGQIWQELTERLTFAPASPMTASFIRRAPEAHEQDEVDVDEVDEAVQDAMELEVEDRESDDSQMDVDEAINETYTNEDESMRQYVQQQIRMVSAALENVVTEEVPLSSPMHENQLQQTAHAAGDITRNSPNTGAGLDRAFQDAMVALQEAMAAAATEEDAEELANMAQRRIAEATTSAREARQKLRSGSNRNTSLAQFAAGKPSRTARNTHTLLIIFVCIGVCVAKLNLHNWDSITCRKPLLVS